MIEILESRRLLSNVLVNNPALDTTALDTQSETTNLVFGSLVLVGYNDSGEFARNAQHFTGYSLSTDGGATFVDKGALPASPFGDRGDPVLARDSVSGDIYFTTLSSNPNWLNVFKSTDGGNSFGAPVNGVPNLTNGSSDKEWITVDNASGAGQGNVYLLNRDFGGAAPDQHLGGLLNGTGPQGIYFTRSVDHGASFQPSGGGTLIVSAVTGNVQGAWITVGSDHSVYAFWYDARQAVQRIMMRKSVDQGDTFGPEILVANLATISTNGDLGLGFRTNTFPQAVVNPADGSAVYVAYDDDAAGVDRGDIFFKQSNDGGATWSAAIRVNDDATTNDQWQPALAVSPDGAKVFVGFYDRRDDAANLLINTYGAVGTTAGSVSFGVNSRISDVSFPAVFGVDPAIVSTYMGDYDTAAADSSGFAYTWSDNRDDSIGRTGKQANVRFARIGGDVVPVPTAPAAPSGTDAVVQGKAQQFGATVTWQDNSDNESSFIVQRSTDGVNWVTVSVLGPNVEQFTDFSIKHGHRSYFYRVAAANDVGQSDWSNTIGIITNPGNS